MLASEYGEALPDVTRFPGLRPDEVRSFVSMGELGWKRFAAGDVAGAESAFRGQLALWTGNPEPHVSLALLASHAGAKKEALASLRAAVVRGFTDFRRLEQSDLWTPMRSHLGFLGLKEDLPRLVEIERRWPGWETVVASRPPESVSAAVREHESRRRILEQIEPALGPRATRLWNRLSDRATAALLEAYVATSPDAADLEAGLLRLMSLYSASPLLRWEVLPPGAGRRLLAVAKTALERYPDSPLGTAALVCRALARYSLRDGRGKLPPDRREEIAHALLQVVTGPGDSPFLALAAEGLVRTQKEAGRPDLAAAGYRAFLERHAASPSLLDEVRSRLGPIALEAGGLPPFRAAALDGVEVDRETLRGKVGVVVFWATWCKPCLDELPVLRRLARRDAGDVAVVGVNLDRAEDLETEALRAFIGREDVPGRQIHDGLSWDSPIVRAFGVTEIPFGVVVRADGTVAAVEESGRRLEDAVRAALGSR